MACTKGGCHQQSIMMQPLDSQDKEVVITDQEESIAVVTPLPRRELFLIWIIHASQGFQTTMLFPMLVFMVEKYGKAGKDGHAVGYNAGLLASLFPLAQVCSAVLWGAVSDRYGRRPWLAFGNFISAVSSLLLGLCQSFASACSVRFFGGLLNGTMIITKSTLAELCDGTNQSKGFGILNLAWGIGAIAGPVFSGLLAEPCVQYYKSTTCPVFLKMHPFLLPCLSATLFSSVAVCAALMLKETNPRNDSKKIPYEQLTYQKIPSQVHPDERDSVSKCHSVPNEAQTKEAQYFAATFRNDPDTDLESDQIKDVNSMQKLLVLISTKQQEEICKKHLDPSSPCLAPSNISTADSDVPLPRSSWIPTIPLAMSILKDRGVLLSSFCYSMTGLIFIITDELFPMFGASSQTVGGLGFSSADLGIILGEGGLVLFVYTLVLYPRVAERLGPLRCFRYGILGCVPIWFLFPACSMLGDHPTLLWSLLLFSMSARSVVGCTTFTGVLILVSNSATSENMGTVTGLSHSFCSFFRAIGPVFGGALWSYTSTKSFPFHQFLAWAFVAVLSIGTYGLSFLLPPSLVRPKDNR
ncbi:unnamed protein product [Calypogeia fissa]